MVAIYTFGTFNNLSDKSHAIGITIQSKEHVACRTASLLARAMIMN